MLRSSTLSTRLTLAIVALVVATAAAVGFLAYRSIASIAVPRTLERAEAHTRLLAGDLANLATNARADVLSLRHTIGLDEVIALSRDDAPILNGLTLAEWRARVARRLAAEIIVKPSYSQLRIIGIADEGREVVRVDRSTSGSVRVLGDAELQRRNGSDYFAQAVASPDGNVVVSPVARDRERDGAEALLPVLRLATPIFAENNVLFGVLALDVDLRAAFRDIEAAARPGTSISVVNERGDYLHHADPSRVFGFERGAPHRVQDDFPGLAAAIQAGDRHAAIRQDRRGESFGVAIASVRLAGGPRLSIVESMPETAMMAAAGTAIRDSSLLAGFIAMLCAVVLAILLARTLARPLTQMTAAVASFAHDRPLSVPVEAGGEIGTLARAFETMAQEVRDKTAAIRRDAEIFESIMSTMAEAVVLLDRDGRIVYRNGASRAMGVTAERAGDWGSIFDIMRPDGETPLPPEEWPVNRSLRGETVDGFEVSYRARQNGRLVHIIGSARPIRDPSGALNGAVLVFRDVTAMKETERQLHQSQKLEAIGQLTGGVAHDFNNVLTVITGTAEMLADGLHDRPHMQAVARLIDQAAERGAELTKHLLAFARRQPLQPADVDLNRLVLDSTRLLRPALGEHIEIEAMLEDDLRPAHIDPAQLSSALLNLAVNARDAMPEGGKLTLETRNVALDASYAQANPDLRPGHYVMLAVSDTGTGIPAALVEKVFEPFFTTKQPGKGTGLGLSMVYGFVKQSGGHVKIYSEEGYGTTVKLYLPRARGVAEAAAANAPAIEGGSETILVVEDDPLVRDFVVTQLRSLGYTTVTAAEGNDALQQLDKGASFDLLFTDVIMPGGMNGRQLADEIARRRPQTRILYTSGYTENAIVHHGRLDPGVMLLPKPYRKSDLARMVRAALEQKAA